MRNVVYASSALRFFGQLAADALGYELVIDAYVGDCDDCHIVGLFDPPIYEHTMERTARSKRRIYHWCGSDVLYLEHPEMLGEGIHVCDSAKLRDELFEKGVYASVVMWPTKHHFPVTPLPETPQITAYLGTNPYKYGADMFHALGEWLAHERPEVKCVGYEFGQLDAETLGKLVNDSTLTVRLTTHDGSGATPREYMEAGRYAITTYDLPHALKVHPGDFVELCAKTRYVLDTVVNPNETAARYWHKQNSTKRFLADLKEALDG